MGLITINCIECKKPFLWYSGRGTDQSCEECLSLREALNKSHVFKDIEGEDFEEPVLIKSADEIYRDLKSKLDPSVPIGPHLNALIAAIAVSIEEEAKLLLETFKNYFEKKKP